MLFKREVGKSPASFLFIRAIPWVLTMTRCAGTRLLLAVTSLYYTFLFALGFWVAGSLNPAIDPISPKWTEL